jgi:alpha-glucosidase (family GH31 glycosyl hydrolase)
MIFTSRASNPSTKSRSYGRQPLAGRARWLTIPALLAVSVARAAPIQVEGIPVELSVRSPAPRCIRVTLMPIEAAGTFPENPALVETTTAEAAIRLREIDAPVTAKTGGLVVEVRGEPLEILVSDEKGARVQKLAFNDKGEIRFPLDGQPVLGLGEGGPRPEKGKDWKTAAVEFDRLGRLHKMEPRWQADAYGSRNPVPLLVGTGGWALFFASPWGQIDLSQADHGRFLPVGKKDPVKQRQNHANQREQLGKGIPPMEQYLPGFRDVFLFDARDPQVLMKDLSVIAGAAVMPPKWALGYMQSHRTLEDDTQMLEIVKTFREKKIPLDAVIYLGTGFTPRGWNKQQPSFQFNPEVFKQNAKQFIDKVHELNAKVVLHVVPWDRDKTPLLDDSVFESYWKDHKALVDAGTDGWWPDEGDWFDLFERIKRHEFYYKGPISSHSDRRPWSLHRNGYLGIARWGGWVWSGDTDSTWKTLQAQVAVGINHSLSISPYWGTDIGGFFPTPELTGELYARWFQFGAFCPSFRSHGRTWWTRLPWGWGLDTLGPVEHPHSPDASTLNDPEIEKIARHYAELRYQLQPYNYTLAWQARKTGMPFIRSLWLHDPGDEKARGIGSEFLWGKDLLVAPVFEKGARSRELYLPRGEWYDWWTGERLTGGRKIRREVDLNTMPIYARAGSIIPLDPVRQYAAEPVSAPTTLLVHPGADGTFTLYEDAGDGPGYLHGQHSTIRFRWDDEKRVLRIGARQGSFEGMPEERTFRVIFAGKGKSPDGEPDAEVKYRGKELTLPPQK